MPAFHRSCHILEMFGWCLAKPQAVLPIVAWAGPITVEVSLLETSILEKDVAFSCADNNNFSGTLKDTIPANSSLQGIDFGKNKLTGRVPASLGNAKRLLYLDLSENQFSGSIPASIGSIRSMYSFSVRRNQLTGGPPLQLANPILVSF